MKETENGQEQEASYKGKPCKLSRQLSKSQRESACRQAVAECANSSDSYCYQERYYDILDKDFYDCIDRNNFPADLMGGTTCSSSPPEFSAKSMVKAKITPLFKKRN